jgi:acylphosphatase
MIEKGYRIRGRVQGVGFRWWTRSQARRLGLFGSVRNCEDGSVEVQVRGPSEAVAHFEQLLQQGPNGAHVVFLEELPPKQMPHDGFSILR